MLMYTNYCRFLGTGNSYRSIAFNFRVGESTVSLIVKEVCDAIWKFLQPAYMPEPSKEFWKLRAADERADDLHTHLTVPLIDSGVLISGF